MACIVTFSDVATETRFLNWVKAGNIKSKSMGAASLNLRASVLELEPLKYLFLWEHFFLFSMSGFMRLMFWMQLRKVRKFTSIDRVRKLDFVELVIKRGIKNG